MGFGLTQPLVFSDHFRLLCYGIQQHSQNDFVANPRCPVEGRHSRLVVEWADALDCSNSLITSSVDCPLVVVAAVLVAACLLTLRVSVSSNSISDNATGLDSINFL